MDEATVPGAPPANATAAAPSSGMKRSHAAMQGRGDAASAAFSALFNVAGPGAMSMMQAPLSMAMQMQPPGNAVSDLAVVNGASKKAAAKEMPSLDETAWEATLQRIPRCSSTEGIRENSYFCNQFSSQGGRTNCLRKLLKEISSLEQNLPTNPAIWIRFDAETPQFLRALITAPVGTPYALGLFCFDIFVPDVYPQAPPKVQLLTTGGGTVRFSPNLYADGKVCLSLLNTWSGPKWSASHSSLLQVLVSIQGLILGVEHPYYLEPGHGGWEGNIKEGNGNKEVPLYVNRQEDQMRVGTLKYAWLEMAKHAARYLLPFREIIDAHFYHHKAMIDHVANEWISTIGTRDRSLKKTVSKTAKELHSVLSQLESPESSNGNSKSADADGKVSVVGDNEGESAVDGKRRAMDEAAAKKDFITAGRLQSELRYLESDGVDSKIATKVKEMEEAASKGDYITAGEIQTVVQHLEQNKVFLQDLERRMFDAAAKLDFVRAGHFQEQYRILLDLEESSKAAFPNAAAKASNPPPSSFGNPFSSALAGALGASGPPPPPPPPPSLFFPPPPSFMDALYNDGYEQGYDY